jgi:hypothetical protein
VKEGGKEREEADSKLTAGLGTGPRNSVRETSESHINSEDATTI